MQLLFHEKCFSSLTYRHQNQDELTEEKKKRKKKNGKTSFEMIELRSKVLQFIAKETFQNESWKVIRYRKNQK